MRIRLEFRRVLFRADATVVTLFLYPDVNLKLKPRLVEQLQPGTRIVSYHHDMGCWQAERTVRVRGAPIYLWTIPASPDAACLNDVPGTDCRPDAGATRQIVFERSSATISAPPGSDRKSGGSGKSVSGRVGLGGS